MNIIKQSETVNTTIVYGMARLGQACRKAERYKAGDDSFIVAKN